MYLWAIGCRWGSCVRGHMSLGAMSLSEPKVCLGSYDIGHNDNSFKPKLQLITAVCITGVLDSGSSTICAAQHML